MAFPGYTGLVGKDAEHHPAVQDGDHQKEDDRFEVTPENAVPENKGDEAINNSAGADMH